MSSPMSTGWRATLGAAGAGLLFGAGLTLAGMTDPRKVLGFLDVAGTWDPTLLFVLGGAVGLALLGYRLVLRRPAPWFDARFHLPAARAIDGRLVLGSALFGVGWGLVGYCPGPAIAALGQFNAHALWLVPALLVGAWLQRRFATRADNLEDD